MVVLANRCESAKRKANRGHYFHYIEGFKLPELYIGRSPQFLQIDNRRNPTKLRRLSILASGQISVIRTPFYSYDIKLCRFDRSLGSQRTSVSIALTTKSTLISTLERLLFSRARRAEIPLLLAHQVNIKSRFIWTLKLVLSLA